ncbi:MAG: histidine kinase dimerization/phospho-acceptor domain-containing protein [Candidatus Auribacterota bacterium]|jgi:signal transduction histidine kinase|nr:histidine kinase dimerization/phospho-acceptor domain-containing protein [Candidatus Auribacterota bacterium]
MTWLILLIASNTFCIVLLFLLLVSYKHNGEQLRNTCLKLEELQKKRSHDLSALSHDLRTPLNAIMGYTSLLLNRVHGDITAKQKEDLERMSQSSTKMLRIIEDYFAETEA